MTNFKHRLDSATVLLLISVFLYVCLRAIRLSITHDEALTYLIHVNGTFRQILFHSLPVNSNNHLMNTLLIKVLVRVFGLSEFVMRIPALAGCALYLIATFRLLRLFTSGTRRLLLTALFASNPFLIDFFSLARGYGLGVGLSMMALSVVLARHLGRKEVEAFRYNALALGLLAAAVLSNISFANLFIAAVATLGAIEMRAGMRHVILVVLRPATVITVMLAVVYNPIVLARITSNLTTWGGTTGFWTDTVGSVVACVLYDRQYLGEATAAAGSAFVCLLLIGGAAVVLHARWWRSEIDQLAAMIEAMLGILLLIAASFKFQFVALGTRYAIDRGGISLVPPFLILMALTWEYAGRRAAALPWAIASSVNGIAIALIVLHGVLSANTTHTFVWRYDAADEAMMARIVADHAGRSQGVTVGGSWLLEPSINFYRIMRHLNWMMPMERRTPSSGDDYYVFVNQDRKYVDLLRLRILFTDPRAGTTLAASAP